jgi:hypothetical protein
MNRMFTAVATLQLVQTGKLALTDALAKALPNYPNQDLARKATIHHLLTHTGGTGDIFGPDFDQHRLELRTLADYGTLYGARDLAFEPGAKMEYSNYGFLLLGVVIEAVSKQAGGGDSTAKDLLAFANAVTSNALLGVDLHRTGVERPALPASGFADLPASELLPWMEAIAADHAAFLDPSTRTSMTRRL